MEQDHVHAQQVEALLVAQGVPFQAFEGRGRTCPFSAGSGTGSDSLRCAGSGALTRTRASNDSSAAWGFVSFRARSHRAIEGGVLVLDRDPSGEPQEAVRGLERERPVALSTACGSRAGRGNGLGALALGAGTGERRQRRAAAGAVDSGPS